MENVAPNMGVVPPTQTRSLARERARTSSRSNLLVGVLLLLTLIVGGYFRFVGMNWDDFIHFHPDERFQTQVASSLHGGLNPSESAVDTVTALEQVDQCLARYVTPYISPEQALTARAAGERFVRDAGGEVVDLSGAAPLPSGYFDAQCSTLNPHNANNTQGFYAYGTMPLLMARLAMEWNVPASEWWAQNVSARDYPELAAYDGMEWLSTNGATLVWRYLSAIAETLVILVVFCIGLRLHGKWVGLIAAILYTGTAFSAQQAHFATSDAIANLFAALSILFAVCVQRQGKLIDYVFFGLAFGAAIASRINLLFLIGLIGLAFIWRIIPAFDGQLAPGERGRIVAKHLFGLALAGIFTLLLFRLMNPYAFNGPGFFGLSLNPRFLDDVRAAQAGIQPAADGPPNQQWASRTEYIYPGWNMIMWGMGLPYGLFAIGATVWALVRLLLGKRGGTLNLILVAWVLVYFGYMGRQWVTTMRYFLPLYPALAVLAAWALAELWRGARARAVALQRGVTPRTILVGIVGVIVVGFPLLWATMYTNIYRNLFTVAQASRWVQENLPGDFSMRVETPENTVVQMNNGQYQAVTVPLINIGVFNFYTNTDQDRLQSRVSRFSEDFNGLFAEQFTAPATGTITTIQSPHLGDPNDDPDAEIMRFNLYRQVDNTLIGTATLDQNLTRETSVAGDPVTILFNAPVQVTEGEEYRFEGALISGPIISSGAVLTWEGVWDEPFPHRVCALPAGLSLTDGLSPGIVGDSRDCNGRDLGGSIITSIEQGMVDEDTESKRDTLIRTLNDTDYVTIHTNRRYDTARRNPLRFPMTNAYYRALFAGELGYELIATFQETYELGPLRVSDQNLPNYGGSEWLNEWESEEAFSVYDHPVVFIFKKTAEYDAAAVNEFFYNIPLDRAYTYTPENHILPGTDGMESSRPCYVYDRDLHYCNPWLVGVATWSTEQADRAPTALMLTEDMRAYQTNGGTWSSRFFRDALINVQPVATVGLWWLAICIFGWAAFPLLFALFPGLADRGYSVAKFAGVFVVAWATWYLASLRIPVWSQAGVLGGLIVLAGISLFVVVRNRASFIAYLRQYWRRLLVIEAITFILFIAFVGIRLTNPDLWHEGYGGEKPMDFGYFQAVLRSTIFPPFDPWQAGNYLNYYYFGFVIVGAPVLLTGIIPSIAYNLIVPTLFAMTGIGAFSVAFNVVKALRERVAKGALSRLGSPWLAGVAAILLCVVLGNLDTPRVALIGLAQMGGVQRPAGVLDFLTDEYVASGGELTDTAMTDLYTRAQNVSIIDRLRYEVSVFGDQLAGVGVGISRLLSGQQLDVAPNRWFWAPRSVLQETPGVEGLAINEMPAFTFIYGDLHAHMIAMPQQFLAMTFILNAVLIAGSDTRKRWLRVLALVLVGVTIGMLRATNTWDWITYMLLGAVGLGFAWWLGWRRISRWSLLGMVGQVGGFIVFSFFAVLPYTTWFSTTYNSVRLWTDGKTPLWAYFDIHGVFLFLIISFFLWETARWFRQVTVRSLRGTAPLLLAFLIIVVTLLAAATIAAAVQYQVALVAVPLLVWAVALFFRQGQTRPMQFLITIIALGIALTLGVEIVVLDGDNGRQNTVFKFYLQAWLFFSVAGGVAVALLIKASERWRGGLRNAFTFGLVVLIGVASLFPIMATRAKATYRMQTVAGADGTQQPIPSTIDGMTFIDYAVQFEGDSDNYARDPSVTPVVLSGDAQMIRWLQDNVVGTPVIIEGLADDTAYRWNGRISIHTGLPAVQGWTYHQQQQRTLDPLGHFVQMRTANVNYFYETDDMAWAWRFLQLHHVEYIISGRYERAYVNSLGLAKFEQMVAIGLLDVAYRTDDGLSTIYRVRDNVAFLERG